MKRKEKYYDRVSIHKTVQSNGLVRCEIFEGYFEDVLLVKFFVPVPKESHSPFGVTDQVIRYRAKHDAGITFGHYSVLMRAEK
jgi:hypothetical protein